MQSQSTSHHPAGSPAASAGLAAHSHWLLRIALACVFLFYGIDKFMGAGVAGFSEMMGLPLLVAYLVAIAEVLAGIGILAG
ncbi:MAG: DoxX family protein, partial [Wenzhouxiangellaceae bacterium]